MTLRIIMFIIINMGIMLTLFLSTTVIGFFGVDIAEYFFGTGSNISILIFATIFGFSGALISLFLSKTISKRSMGVNIIKEDTKNQRERWIYDFVDKLSKDAKIKMPEVGIFVGSPNAFATGYSKNESLIAVSTGLLDNMTQNEVEGVIAHEMSHIVNGDMVTMTLLQGVLNTFVIYFARIIGAIVDKAILKNKSDEKGIGYYASVFVLEIVFSIAASIIMAFFSRHREYKADEGAVKFHGKNGIYNALKKLGELKTEPVSKEMKAFGIVSFIGLFSTHPAIEKRLEHIKKL